MYIFADRVNAKNKTTMKKRTILTMLSLLLIAGVSFAQGEQGRSRGSSTTGVTTTTQATGTKNKSALDLVYNPMGVLRKDGTGLTRSNVISTLEANYSWKLTKGDNDITAWKSDGYNVSWNGVPVFVGRVSFDNGVYWHYSINFNKDQYSKSQALDQAKRFCRDLQNAGFSMTSDVLDGRETYPLDKILRKGSYEVIVTLIVSSSWYQYDIDVWPNGK